MRACGTEMVFSQGTVWPPDVHKAHGLVLCCGLFYLQSCASVLAFMDAVVARAAVDKDDQVSVNRLVADNGVQWNIAAPYRVAFREKEFIASEQAIHGTVKTGPSVSVLPHHLFPRFVQDLHPKAVVAYPLSPKTCAQKIEELSRLGLWSLP